VITRTAGAISTSPSGILTVSTPPRTRRPPRGETAFYGIPKGKARAPSRSHGRVVRHNQRGATRSQHVRRHRPVVRAVVRPALGQAREDIDHQRQRRRSSAAAVDVHRQELVAVGVREQGAVDGGVPVRLQARLLRQALVDEREEAVFVVDAGHLERPGAGGSVRGDQQLAAVRAGQAVPRERAVVRPVGVVHR